jgi:dienelactone hydrolase
VVLIVHGDGPQDRYSADGYIPLINALLDAGIGVFSWDKPGIGESEGDWRKQSMDDRASEARAAHDAVRRAAGRKVGAIGYLGFSQAGWVLPTLAGDPDTDAFFVLVGGAVNWQRQGAYLTRSRLQGLGWSEDAIAAEIDRQAAAEAALDDAPDETARIDAAARLFGLSRERAGFVLRNRDADATEALRKAGAPFLALWGEADLNVDGGGQRAGLCASSSAQSSSQSRRNHPGRDPRPAAQLALQLSASAGHAVVGQGGLRRPRTPRLCDGRNRHDCRLDRRDDPVGSPESLVRAAA